MRRNLGMNLGAMLLGVFIFAAAPSESIAKDYPTTGSIEREDSAINQLIPKDAKMEILAEGFDWSEGPLWVPEGNFLLFSDIPPNTVHQWKEGKGLSTYLKPSGYTSKIPRGGEIGSNGLLLDAQGRLVLCQHGDRRIGRMMAPILKPESTFITLADRYKGKRLNSPNDAVYAKNGNLYFTDPPYGLEKNIDDPSKELDFQGVYLLRPNGEIVLLTDQMSRPNGIALAPDQQTLYVANSDGEHPVWMRFPMLDDGTVGEGKAFFDARNLPNGRKGGGDGMKVDVHGNVFATGPGGVLVISPNGDYLGTIATGRATSNCAFGEDGKSLFITADDLLLRVRLTTTGFNPLD